MTNGVCREEEGPQAQTFFFTFSKFDFLQTKIEFKRAIIEIRDRVGRKWFFVEANKVLLAYAEP